MVKKLIKNFTGLMVGTSLMGATASQVNALPAGTARDLAGTAVGLQGVALVGHSMKMLPGDKIQRSKKIKTTKTTKKKIKFI